MIGKLTKKLNCIAALHPQPATIPNWYSVILIACLEKLAHAGGEIAFNPDDLPSGFTAEQVCCAITGEMNAVKDLVCVLCAADEQEFPQIYKRCTNDEHRRLGKHVKTYIFDGGINLFALLHQDVASGIGLGAGLRGCQYDGWKPSNHRHLTEPGEPFPYTCPRIPSVFDTNYPTEAEGGYVTYVVPITDTVQVDVDLSELEEQQSEVGGGNENATQPNESVSLPDSSNAGVSFESYSKRADRVSCLQLPSAASSFQTLTLFI